MTGVRQSYRKAGGIAVLLVLVAQPLRSQDPTRVHWPLLDCVLRRAVPGAVELLAAPSPFGRPSGSMTALDRLSLQSILTMQWVAATRAVMDSLERHGHPSTLGLIGPPLPDLSGHAFVGIGYDPSAERGSRYFFLLNDSTDNRYWRTGGSEGQVRDLLKAFENVAQQAGVVVGAVDDTLTTPACYQRESCQETRPRLLSVPPLQYPWVLRREGRQGRVWLEFVVDTLGRVDSSSVNAVLSDGGDFTDAATRSLLRAQFAPASVDGRLVRRRTYLEARFALVMR